jgi:hypothetical protein
MSPSRPFPNAQTVPHPMMRASHNQSISSVHHVITPTHVPTPTPVPKAPVAPFAVPEDVKVWILFIHANVLFCHVFNFLFVCLFVCCFDFGIGFSGIYSWKRSSAKSGELILETTKLNIGHQDSTNTQHAHVQTNCHFFFIFFHC